MPINEPHQPPREIKKLDQAVVNRIAAGEIIQVCTNIYSLIHTLLFLTSDTPIIHPTYFYFHSSTAPCKRSQGTHREQHRCWRNSGHRHCKGRRHKSTASSRQRLWHSSTVSFYSIASFNQWSTHHKYSLIHLGFRVYHANHLPYFIHHCSMKIFPFSVNGIPHPNYALLMMSITSKL